MRAVFRPLQYTTTSEEFPTTPEAVNELYEEIVQSIDVIKGWAERIPGFGDLCREDQELLLKSASLELFVLRLAHR